MKKDHQKDQRKYWGCSLRPATGRAAFQRCGVCAEQTNWRGGPRQPRPDQKEKGEGRRVIGSFELPLDRARPRAPGLGEVRLSLRNVNGVRRDDAIPRSAERTVERTQALTRSPV